MEEVVAIVGGVVAFGQVAHLAYKTWKRARRLARDMSMAGEEVENLANELYDYSKLLESMDDTIMQLRDIAGHTTKELQFQDSQLDKADHVLYCFERLLDDLEPLASSGMLMKAKARFTWATSRKGKVEVMRWLLMASQCNLSVLAKITNIKTMIHFMQELRTKQMSSSDERRLLRLVKTLNRELYHEQAKAERITMKYENALNEYGFDLAKMPRPKDVARESIGLAKQQFEDTKIVLRESQSGYNAQGSHNSSHGTSSSGSSTSSPSMSSLNFPGPSPPSYPYQPTGGWDTLGVAEDLFADFINTDQNINSRIYQTGASIPRPQGDMVEPYNSERGQYHGKRSFPQPSGFRITDDRGNVAKHDDAGNVIGHEIRNNYDSE